MMCLDHAGLGQSGSSAFAWHRAVVDTKASGMFKDDGRVVGIVVAALAKDLRAAPRLWRTTLDTKAITATASSKQIHCCALVHWSYGVIIATRFTF
jgi:hypothetical protein